MVQKGRGKMTKLTTLFAVAGLVFALAPAAQAQVSLPDPGAVGPYRVVFQTSEAGSRDYTTMDTFDVWATGLAQAAGAVDDGGALNTTWNVIGATAADSNILSRTATHPVDDLATSVPIYLVDGTLYATSYATFWSSDVTIIDNPNIADTGHDYTLYLDEKGNIGDPGGGTHTGLTTIGDNSNTLPILAAGQGLDIGATGAIRHGGGNRGYNNATYPWFAGGSGDTWNTGNSRVFAISGVIAPPTTGTVLIIR
jgi:hypothetical protein